MEYRFENTSELIPRKLWNPIMLKEHERIREEFLDYTELTNIIYNEYTKKYDIENLGYNLVNVICERVDWNKINKSYRKEFKRYWNKLPIAKKEFLYELNKMNTDKMIYSSVKKDLFIELVLLQVK